MGKRSRSRGGISCNGVVGDGSSCATGGGSSAAAPTVKRTRRSVPRETPAPRSSAYRGVTRHRWTGRYEAHLWDKSCWSETQNKKGRQVYLGAYDDEEAAARAYDLAALKYWGQETALNFPVSAYQEELKEMGGQSKEEYVGSIRRKSSGFSRGVSKYRGVARHHHNGRWEARIGRVFGNKYLYLGTYATQEEAAMAYDRAAIHYRGLNAVTNFDLSRYIGLLGPHAENSDYDGAGTPRAAALPPTPENIVPGLSPRGFPRHPAGGSEENMSPDKSPAGVGDANTPPAMGVLLESAKLKEMLRRTTTGAEEPPATPPEREHQQPPAGRFFPHDVKTFFDCPDGGGVTEEDDVIFGDLDSFMSIVLCELDG